MEQVSRRSFIAGAGAALSTVAATASASAALAVEPCAPTEGGNVPESWDLECDVLVIGAGGAGLSVAWAAAEEGADVLVLESQGSSSACTTYYCFGNFNVIGSDEQAQMGIEDSPQNMLDDVWKLGGAEVTPSERTLLNPDLILQWGEHTREAYDLLKGWGLDFSRISDQKGNLTMRCHQIDNRQMIDILAEQAPAAGARVMYNTPFTGLVTNGNGEVLGCFAEDADGKPLAIKGKKATVLATGPLLRNKELMEDALPGSSSIDVISGVGAYGDGHVAAMNLGGALWGRNTLYACEQYLPDTMVPTELNQFGAISVSKDGRRIYDDGSQWNNRRTRLLIDDGINPKTGTYFTWYVIDQKMYDAAMAFPNENQGLTPDKVQYLYGPCDTVEELAELLEAPELPATVARYNEDLENGGDTQWGRVYNNGSGTGDPTPLTEPPFYAWPTRPAFYFAPCFSFMADSQMQILNADCEPIGGGRLYGAGEIIERSVLGNCYLVGGSISFCVASGIQLGRQVAALEDWDA